MARSGVVPAGPGRRLLAALIDLALAAGAGAVVAAAVASAPTPSLVPTPDARGAVLVAGYLLVLALGVTQWVLQGRRGWTLGKRATAVRVLDAGTGLPVGLGRTALRFAVLGLGSVLTVLSVLLDGSGRRRGWHDLAAGTAVIDVARGIDPSVTPAVTATSAGHRLDALLAPPPAPAPAPPPAVPPAVPPAAPSAPPTPPPVVGPAPLTELPEGLEETRLSSVRRREVPATAGTSVTLWDGRSLDVTGTVLIGRNPTPRDGEPAPAGTLPVADPGRSVSKTHLLVGTDPHGLWIQDRDSTNGTIVTLADGQQILCAADQTVRVPVGASVAFGDFWFTVTP